MTPESLDTVPAPLRAALERRGITTLTTVQGAALEVAGTGRDLQISSQTGSGKTVALGMVAAPELLESSETNSKGPQVLIIVPTRELAAQVRDELAWLYADVPAVTFDCVTGGTSTGAERWRLRQPPRVLVGTPGRLLDHLTGGALSLEGVQQLVLDEADQMLDMGFREDLEAILQATPAERRTHLVSATLPPAIRDMAQRYQRDPLHVEGTRLGEANVDIEHVAFRVRDQDRYAGLVNLLVLTGGERTLVFVNTRAETSDLAQRLASDGFAALPLSGELAQSQRNYTLAAFKDGSTPILVATDVASRGLDVPDVATVIHTAPCLDAEIYTHRSGRTGRAGRKGRSFSLITGSMERKSRRLLNQVGVKVEWRALPTAEELELLIDERERAALAERLENAGKPSEAQVAHARELIADGDPAELVATLLEQLRPAKAPQPREVQAAPDRHASKFDRAPAGRYERGQRPDRRPVRDGDGPPSFRINWGFQAGANPKRILAHVCRRGRINGRDVGAIRVQSHFTTFEIHPDVAREFEAAARERDARDPHLHIQRDFPGRRGDDRQDRRYDGPPRGNGGPPRRYDGGQRGSYREGNQHRGSSRAPDRGGQRRGGPDRGDDRRGSGPRPRLVRA